MGTYRGIAAAVATFFVGLAALIGAGTASAAMSDVPTPNVQPGPQVNPASHPFLRTDIELSDYGYEEWEYFVSGDAYRYDTSGGPDQTAERIETGGPNDDGKYPFETRIMVRSPKNPADANGVVIVEWNNVTSFQDVEFNWFGDPYYLLKNGYTFVGVTAQTIGVNSLKAFNNGRYGTLTVNGNGTVPTGTGLDPDALSYDIFSSVVKAIKGGGTGLDPINGIDAKTVIASGESQSCGRLSNHYNKIEPIHEIVDAYLLTVCTSALRTDRPEKAVRIITESENRFQRPVANYPDTDSIRHWEVAGASHLPRVAFDNLNGVFSRDFATVTADCTKFPLSRVKWPFTQNVAIRDLASWSNGGAAPPIAPRGEYLPDGSLARDEYGIAKGGIRYPDVTVPTAVNDGLNSPASSDNIFSNFCPLFGSSTPFSSERLHALYGDFLGYIDKYFPAIDDLVESGFLLREDGNRLMQDAWEYPRLRPAVNPGLTRLSASRSKVDIGWVGTMAPDTTFQFQRKGSKGGWKAVTGNLINPAWAFFPNEPQGTYVYRVRSTTVIPGTNISEPETVVTPYSVGQPRKVDRSGPWKPKIVLKGRKVKGAYRGKVRVKVIGRPDRKLPDGTAGVGLNKKSVPKLRVVKRKGKTVIKVRTKDKLGNKSPVARVVIRIKR